VPYAETKGGSFTSGQWAEAANNVLAETGDEGRAVRSANAVVARAKRHPGVAEGEFGEREDGDSSDN